MTMRAWAVVLAAIALCAGGRAAAQEERQELARELARLMLDDTVRRGLDEQVATGIVRGIGTTLQQRLNRPLQDPEWRMLGGIVQRFVGETLRPGRTEDIAARIYANHFDDAELRELVRFQKSEVGRKAARLTPVIGAETAQAIDDELRQSVAMPVMLAELQQAFPVLKALESP